MVRTPCMNALELSKWTSSLTGWWDIQKLDSCVTRTDLIANVDADNDSDDGCDDHQLTSLLRFDVWTFKMVPNYIMCQANTCANKDFLVHLIIIYYGCVPCCKYCRF